jgi:hypothetical protein
MVPLLAVPMKVAGGDCGTIFSSSKTWKYNSDFDPATDLQSRASGAHSQSDLDNALSGSIDAMMADNARGSAIYDQCKDRHTTRLIWIIAVGVPIVLIGGASVLLFLRNRRSKRVGTTEVSRASLAESNPTDDDS